ncbi:MAG: hypothetical protein LBP20_04040 [Treponema sp.]|jgi:hypothetical protein|nr:hypothetical protein [Treponema sp.]
MKKIAYLVPGLFLALLAACGGGGSKSAGMPGTALPFGPALYGGDAQKRRDYIGALPIQNLRKAD